LWHCATIQKVAGLIPYSVNGIFIDIILPAGSGMSSASNRIEYQEYFLGGKGGRCVGLTTLPPSCAGCLEIWNPQCLSRSVMGLLYLFTYCTHPRISNGPALGRIGLYIIRACKHPVIATCPFFAVLTQQSLTAPRLLSYVGSTTIWFCCACHLQLILVVWG